jgi:hypothetical protein
MELYRGRDKRNKGWFWIDNEYLNGYAKIFGPVGTAVYLSLCRHANSDQQCFPAMETIAEEIGASRQTVSKYLGLFEKHHLLSIEKERDGATKKWRNNVYTLLDKSLWDSHVKQTDMDSHVKLTQNSHVNPVNNKETNINTKKTNIVSDETFTSFEEYMESKGYTQNSSVDEDREFVWWELDGQNLKKTEETALRKEFKNLTKQPSEVDRLAEAIISAMRKHHGKAPMITYAEKKRIYDNLIKQLDKDELKDYAQWYFVDGDLPFERRMNLYSFTDAYWVNKFRSQ